MNTKLSKLKTNSTAIVLVLLMTSVMIMALPVQAADICTQGAPPSNVFIAETTPTVCSLSARPAVVGMGQYILINAWLNPAITAQRAVKTFEFTITDPDGKVIEWSQDSENATAATWLEYTLDKVGEWKIKVKFTGCYFNGSQASGSDSAYYMPSEAPEKTVICQEEIISSWPAAQLPTDYWTRPVTFELREWWPILGNFPATGYDGFEDSEWETRYPNTNPRWSSNYGFTPWVQTPKSSHIVWIEWNAQGGIVGGQAGKGGNTIGSDLSTSSFLSTMVYGGRGYRTVIKPTQTMVNGTIKANPASVWQSYDLRTGEVYWEIPVVDIQMPTVIEYSTSVTSAAISGGAVTGYLVYIGITTNTTTRTSTVQLVRYNPFTGAVVNNISMAVTPQISGTTYYKNQQVLSIQDFGASAGSARYRLINWSISGSGTNFAARIGSNTSYARSSLPSYIDWNANYGATVSGTTVAGIMAKTSVSGFNLWTGESLWNVTLNNATLYSGSTAVADHGKIAFLLSRVDGDFGYYTAYDLATGNLAWKGEVLPYPWSSTAFGAYGVASAYGLIIHPGYAGLSAINWETGKTVWNYHMYSQAPFESPYTDENGTEVFSFNSGVRIADGMVITYNCEHTTTFPRTRGWSTVAVNITNGEEVWSIMMPGNAAFGNNPDIGAIADGYMTMESALGHFIVFGKGKSATSLTTPDIALTQGQSVMIKGSVLDQSPAQEGTPCVSKDSMSTQMEYIHLQMPIAGIWQNETITGVPVSLDTVDPNGNYIHIADITTDGYSGTFGYSWEPEIPGEYTITATFMGDESYGSSFATSYVSVTEAPVETVAPTPTPIVMPPFELYTIGSAVAVIVAIAVAVLLLRKRP